MLEIAKPTKVHHRKLGAYQRNIRLIYCSLIISPARVLRVLASNHIFIEVSPEVFANNRLSSVLDTGKPVEELLAKLVISLLICHNELNIVSPESKHIGTLGITSILEHVYELLVCLLYGTQTLMRFFSLDEGFKSSSYLTETLLDPELGHAYEPNKAAFNKAYNVEEGLWTWYEAPENRLQLVRFGAGMDGIRNMSSPDAILGGSSLLRGFCDTYLTLKYGLAGFAWGQLPEGSLVVDVGGGVGSQCLMLALHHPHLRFIVQDRESVVGDAVEVRIFNPLTSFKIMSDNILNYSTGRRICLTHSNPVA